MAIQYKIQYYNTANVKHECTIDVPSYVGEVQLIRGSVVHARPEVDDVLEALRGSELTINLEANKDLDFRDLYIEDERFNEVVYKIDDKIEFVGYLKSDGYYRDYVNSEWVVTMKAVDGVGLLKNLSYVDSAKEIYVGKEKEIKIVANCLKRTGLSLDICVDIIVIYDGLNPSLDDVLDKVKMNQFRFVKEDGYTIMDCETVLRSILEKYRASLFQVDGKWVITNLSYKSLAENRYKRYDSGGDYIEDVYFSMGSVIGSDINNAEIFHMGKDQRIELSPSISAYRINYKYGFLSNLNVNPGFKNDGVTAEGWNLINPGRAVYVSEDNSVTIFGDNEGGVALTATSTILMTLGDSIAIKIFMRNIMNRGFFRARLVLTDGTDTYTLNEDGTWHGNGNTNIDIEIAGIGSEINTGIQEFNIKSEGAPINGDLTIHILSADPDPNPIAIKLHEFVVTGAVNDENVQGEFHTFSRKTNTSSVIKNNKEISVGDGPSDIYSGALYKEDGETLTDEWTIGLGAKRSILNVMGVLTMSAAQKPSQVFSGSVYGKVKYPGSVSIEGVGINFIIKSYKYHSIRHVTELVLQETFVNSVTSDLNYTKTYDYGGNVSPTIN